MSMYMLNQGNICHEKSKPAKRAPGSLRENFTSTGTAPVLLKLFQNEPNVSGTWFCPAKTLVRENEISIPWKG